MVVTTPHLFRPGDQIICIDASPSRWINAAPVLEAGAAYTVERTGNKPAGRGGPVSPGVHLAEARFADPDHKWLVQVRGGLGGGAMTPASLAAITSAPQGSGSMAIPSGSFT